MKPWSEASALEALLSDPVVQLAMRADRVEPQALKSLLADVSRRIAARRAPRLLAGPSSFRRAALPGSAKRDAPPLDRGAVCGLAPCW